MSAVAASMRSALFRRATRAAVASPASTSLFSTSASARANNDFKAPPPIHHPQSQGELAVGELEGAKFRVEPLRRVGEDEKTMRARLVYQSRKRGTLESDLLLSTFAAAYLPTMTREEMTQFDLFLDENDWDIYYWATQEDDATAAGTSPQSTTTATTSSAEGGEREEATYRDDGARKPAEGEWAQTIGTFRPAYRPVPARWRDTEVLRLLREHVRRRSKGGAEGGGMGFMPSLR